MTFLTTILQTKREEISMLGSLEDLKQRAKKSTYIPVLPKWDNNLNVIAEIKRKSPSKGELAEINDPVSLAKTYATAGASVISVLTDQHYFGANPDDFSTIRQAVSTPLLRKDFIIDPRQVYETYLMNADVMLLIVAAFDDPDELTKLYQLGKSLGLEVLVETHSTKEIEIAQELGANLIGVNVRDLSTFEEKPSIGDEMIKAIGKEVVSVWESSISTIQDATRAKIAGARAVLIGQALVQHEDPAGFIEQIRGIA